MSEQRTLRPIGEVLRSPRFLKEVSVLLFVFAGVQVIISVLLFARDTSDPIVLFTASEGFIVAIINVVLGVLIRNGSFGALVFTGILFALDILVLLFGPSWQGVKGALISRGLLIFVLINFIQRQRRVKTSAVRN